MNEFKLYDIECLTNFDHVNNFQNIWNGVLMLDKNNFFYGIGKTNIGYRILMVGVYIQNKGIRIKTFQQKKKYITEYTCDFKSKGTICTLFENRVEELSDCKFNIKENKTLDPEYFKKKIDKDILKIIENKFQKYMFLDSINNYDKMIEEINDCYDKTKYLAL